MSDIRDSWLETIDKSSPTETASQVNSHASRFFLELRNNAANTPNVNEIADGFLTQVLSRQPHVRATAATSQFYLDAARSLRVWTQQASTAARFATSARAVFQHVISDEQLILDREQVEELIEESNERLREIAHERANIEAFQRTLRAYFGAAVLDVEHRASEGYYRPRRVPPETYWRNLRDDLQEWFAVGLERLSELVGVSKVTLLKLAEPGRELRGPTVRKLQAVYASARAVAEAEEQRGLTWLRTTGSSLLTERGLGAFEEAVDQRVFSRPVSLDSGESAALEDDQLPKLVETARVPDYVGVKGRF
jgi:hypothetical protein